LQASVKAIPLLSLFHALNTKYDKDYCFPAQLTILSLLKDRQGFQKSRATLNRWLRVIEDDRYIKRKRRIKRHKVYGMVFHSTLYKITRKGYFFMARIGINVSKEIARIIAAKKAITQKAGLFKKDVKPGVTLADLVKAAFPESETRPPG